MVYLPTKIPSFKYIFGFFATGKQSQVCACFPLWHHLAAQVIDLGDRPVDRCRQEQLGQKQRQGRRWMRLPKNASPLMQIESTLRISWSPFSRTRQEQVQPRHEPITGNRWEQWKHGTDAVMHFARWLPKTHSLQIQMRSWSIQPSSDLAVSCLKSWPLHNNVVLPSAAFLHGCRWD